MTTPTTASPMMSPAAIMNVSSTERMYLFSDQFSAFARVSRTRDS